MWTVLVIILVVAVIAIFYIRSNQFELPEGDTVPIEEIKEATFVHDSETTKENTSQSDRQVFVTDGVKHSIPLDEILSGGPPKDGIPSLDNPEFVSVSKTGDDLDDDSIGLGLVVDGEARFYPYDILVWHEIVNDSFGAVPVLVTYCPLCRTGVVFDRRVGGEPQEFGVSGKLWKSNLLMYNRTGNEDTESLWSQVLGEAVLGVETGSRLTVISSDTVKYGDWKVKNPKTTVLSRETGTIRPYGTDPYGGYYTDDTVSFGATFDDDRLHPKAFVFGIEIDGQYKAYDGDALNVGTTNDTFAGSAIVIGKDSSGSVRISIGGEEVSYISGFWFSWLAVHPDTEVFTK